MTATEDQQPVDAQPAPATPYPWHAVPPPVPEMTVRASVRGLPAGLVTRVIAAVVDVVLVVLLVAGGYAAVAAVRFLVHPTGFRLPDPGLELLLEVGLGVLAVYLAVTWAVVGGTYGDRLLALRVVGPRGERLRWRRAAVRAVLCTLFPIGLFWVLVSRGNRSVQDLLVRTAVVYDA